MSKEPLNKRYKIKKQLGQGSFGITFLASDKQSKQDCVIKQLTLEKMKDWKSLELFEREANTLKSIDHPYIPNFIDFFTIKEGAEAEMYLVQEYIDAENLQELVDKGRRFSFEQIKSIAIQLAQVLVYLHQFSPSIIHRDIKPSNLLYTSDGIIHLIDFGAVYQPLGAGQGSTIVGTFGYMPLEQFEGRVTPASDIYALGASLLFLLSAKEPNQWPKKGLEFDLSGVQVPSGFKRILAKMIAPNLDERYHSAKEVLTALESSTSGASKKLLPLLKNKKTWAVLGGLTSLIGLYLMTPSKQEFPSVKKTYQPSLKTKHPKQLFVQVKNETPPWKSLSIKGASKFLTPKKTLFAQSGDLWAFETSYVYHIQGPKYNTLNKWLTNTLPGKGYFKDILETKNGEIWILRNQSVIYFKNKQWHLAYTPGKASIYPYGLALYKNKPVIVLKDRLLIWDVDHFKPLVKFEESFSYPKLFNNKSTDTLWVFPIGNTLWEYKNDQLHKVRYFEYGKYKTIEHVAATPDGNLLLSGKGGIVRYHPKNGSITPLYSSAAMTHTVSTKPNQIWGSSKYEGLLFFNGTSWKTWDWRRGLKADSILHMAIGPQKQVALSTKQSLMIAPQLEQVEAAIKQVKMAPIIKGKWLGKNCSTVTAHLKNHPSQQIQVIDYNKSPHVFINGEQACPRGIGFAKDSQNYVVYKDPIGKPASLYWNQKGRLAPLSAPKKIKGLKLTSEGKIYASTGYYYKDKHTRLYEHNRGAWNEIFDGKPYKFNRHIAFELAPKNKIYVGGSGYSDGPSIFKISEGKATQVDWPSSSRYSRSTHVIKHFGVNNLAVGSSGGLAIRYHNELILFDSDELPGSEVQQINIQADGIWFSYGKHGRGLSFYNLKTKAISHISSRQGLWMDHISHFGFDGQNRIWLRSTGGSLAYHDKTSLLKSMVHDTLSIKE